MSSYSSERGAVHILFLVFVLIIALAFGALWFVEVQNNEKLTADALRANRAASAAQVKEDYKDQYFSTIAPIIGGGVPTSIPWDEAADLIPSEEAGKHVQRLQVILAGLGAEFDDAAAKPSTLVDGYSIPRASQNKLKNEITQLKATIERLNNEVAAKQRTIDANLASYQTEKDQAAEEYKSTRSTQDSQLSDLRSQNDDLSTRVRETTDNAANEREKANAELTAASTKVQELDGSVRAIKSDLRTRRETKVPDGKILAVDPITGQVFINLGSNHSLRRGTRFQVLEVGKGGVKTPKGYVTVTDTQVGMSEARIDETIAGRRVESDDIIYNPVYSKNAETRFVFLGQLPGKYTRETAERILKKQGAKVDKDVSVRTDFIVLGISESEDEDLTNSDQYRKAIRWGIEVIRARDLAPYLQF